MATKTFHISFPVEWAEEIEKEIKNDHYTPTEYFKDLYRKIKLDREYSEFQEAVECYEKEKKAGTLKKLTSLKDLM